MVYLICFDEKYYHCKHYIGWTKDDTIDKRLALHRAGHGAKLLAALVRAGISFEPVRIWQDADGFFERMLKNHKKAQDFCPICNPDKYHLYPKIKKEKS